MRNTILTKFLIIYLVIVMLGFFCVSLVSYRLDYNNALYYTAESMYRQALSISSDYAEHYYAGSLTLEEMTTQLDTVATYDSTEIMVLGTNGDILLSTYNTTVETPVTTIESFDPAAFGSERYISGNFYGYFDADYLTVMTPISFGMTIRGYVLIHKSILSIKADIEPFFNTNYITMVMCMVLASIFIFCTYTEVHKPVNEITQAVKEFGHGNLNYQLKEYNDDDIGRLAAALTYMSTQLNELEESQKKFVANVSHDFRSPLTSIKGYLEAILDGTIPPEMQEKYLNIVIFETERLSKLTNNLLTLNNMDPKKNRLNIEPFDINLVIKRTIETFEGTCKNKGIQFDLTFSDKVTMVNADLDKISQVLYNLIDNAIKFSHQNSSIFISVTERGEKAFVSVKDAGIGIPKDSVSKIWDRFYKTDLSRGKDKKGTGLGLSIVKEVINAHQENIDVISTEGVGTEFIFSLAKYAEK